MFWLFKLTTSILTFEEYLLCITLFVSQHRKILYLTLTLCTFSLYDQISHHMSENTMTHAFRDTFKIFITHGKCYIINAIPNCPDNYENKMWSAEPSGVIGSRSQGQLSLWKMEMFLSKWKNRSNMKDVPSIPKKIKGLRYKQTNSQTGIENNLL